jgi:hypothetical protein
VKTNDLIARLNPEFEADFHQNNDGDLHCSGESADGVPEWLISIREWSDGSCSYGIKRIIGWYEQEGEADNVDDLVLIMHAMDAAAAAFNDATRRQ